MNRSFALGCALLVSVFAFGACGGDDDDDDDSPSGPSCSGAQLTEAQLCQLTCGQTTEEQAKAVLGAPTASASNLLDYRYTCIDTAAGTGDALSWSIYFSNGVLARVSRTGTGSFAGGTVPACVAACM